MCAFGRRVPVSAGRQLYDIKVTPKSGAIPSAPEGAFQVEEIKESEAAVRTICPHAIELTAFGAVSTRMRPETAQTEHSPGWERLRSGDLGLRCLHNAAFTCERSAPKGQGAHPAQRAGRGSTVMATLKIALVRCNS